MEHNDTIKILTNKKFPKENDEKKNAERFERVNYDFIKSNYEQFYLTRLKKFSNFNLLKTSQFKCFNFILRT